MLAGRAARLTRRRRAISVGSPLQPTVTIMTEPAYAALASDTIAARLGGLGVLAERLGPDPAAWRAVEVGDGNLNLVFIVAGPRGKVVVKQALPYVRLVGESWPLPLKRSWFEHNALIRQAERAPGCVPEVLHFDRGQALIVMQCLEPHTILRRNLIAGVEHPGLARFLGEFCARTLFRGSDLSMTAAARKADLGLFADNVELCDITESLVFTDPYRQAPLNRHTSPQLDALAAELRRDVAVKIAAQHLKMRFSAGAETLLHGDLHTGSIMAAGESIFVIDPEFATYGPMGFDVGMLISNLLMAYLSQPGHAAHRGARDAYGEWVLEVARGVWDHFAAEFARLWRSERRGMLYPAALFEEQGQGEAAEVALADRLAAIWQDAVGFCGVEMHRRILGLAHNADFEAIADAGLRAACEGRALRLGRLLMTATGRIADSTDLIERTRALSPHAPGLHEI